MPKYAEHISCFIIFHLWSALARFTPSFLPATRSFCAVDLPTFLGRDQSSLNSTPPDYSLKTLPGVPDRFLSRKHAASAKLSWQQSSPFVAHLEYLSNIVGGYTGIYCIYIYRYISIYWYTPCRKSMKVFPKYISFIITFIFEDKYESSNPRPS
jgi:hypothetical protein